MHLKMSSGTWRPFYLVHNLLEPYHITFPLKQRTWKHWIDLWLHYTEYIPSKWPGIKKKLIQNIFYTKHEAKVLIHNLVGGNIYNAYV